MVQYNNKTVFSKLIEVINGNKLNYIINKYNSDYRIQHFNTKSHVFSMLYLQLSNTKSLRGLIDKLNYSPKLQRTVNVPSLSQLSRKNANRDYRIFEELYYSMINMAKKELGIKKSNEKFKEIKAFDSTVITIASSLAPELFFEGKSSGIKISTLLNISQSLPEKVNIVPAKINDRKCIDDFFDDKDTLYLFDRGYYNYNWYDNLTDNGYKFITRQNTNAVIEEIRSTYVENELVFDAEITLGTDYSKNKTHNKYREILTFDEEGKEIRFLTNVFDIEAEEIMELYRLRWKIELFFKWVKQNLKIKKWLGHNQNAVKIQIYSALISYVILALLKTRMKIKSSMISISRIIEVNLLEESSVLNLLSG
ncbi:IS4 family transposase [Tissierella pigra]|nr:IS4 family transposase [Tissierella pigra]MBU5425219.1 IS4 family transposase [Tissierella pigra]MBU5426020.1 IS4 family transposase [Tissierella pigra]MBU5426032.1 IS4 family transposase [Tissierella pigra]MBU5427174.1 IS4 family transposase [Tissierella pigra]MBU5427506.1 IS4 family transposase [Tissierella pigra]